MRPTCLLLLPRLYLAMIFCVAAIGKLRGGRDFSGAMAGFLSDVTLKGGYGWYQGIVRSLVLPHAHTFAWLVIIAESCIGISMLFGLATRAGAVVAIFLLLNYLCAKGLPFWSPGSNDMADIVLALVVLFGAAGRFGGIDKSLHERFPKVPLW